MSEKCKKKVCVTHDTYGYDENFIPEVIKFMEILSLNSSGKPVSGKLEEETADWWGLDGCKPNISCIIYLTFYIHQEYFQSTA